MLYIKDYISLQKITKVRTSLFRLKILQESVDSIFLNLNLVHHQCYWDNLFGKFLNRNLEECKQDNYYSLQSKSLLSIGHIYREQKKNEESLTILLQSLNLLDTINSKMDIPETYFQIALTYQAIGDQANSQEYFNKAIYLWSKEQIDAPKQIERVRKAMNCEH